MHPLGVIVCQQTMEGCIHQLVRVYPSTRNYFLTCFRQFSHHPHNQILLCVPKLGRNGLRRIIQLIRFPHMSINSSSSNTTLNNETRPPARIMMTHRTFHMHLRSKAILLAFQACADGVRWQPKLAQRPVQRCTGTQGQVPLRRAPPTFNMECKPHLRALQSELLPLTVRRPGHRERLLRSLLGSAPPINDKEFRGGQLRPRFGPKDRRLLPLGEDTEERQCTYTLVIPSASISQSVIS